MLNRAMIGAAVALVLGGASVASAGEGLQGFSSAQAQHRVFVPAGAHAYAPEHRSVRAHPLDAYGWDHGGVRPFTWEEQLLFDRATGRADNSP